jgi:hypothetical protein
MSTDNDPQFFSIFPDEIVERILKDATEFPGEFKISHPDDGDLMFTAHIGRTCTFPADEETEWKISLLTRRSLVLVCKRFLRIATPILYSSLFVSGHPKRCVLLWRTLQEKVALCLFRRIAVGTFRNKDIAHVIGSCPNLIIVESDTPFDLNCLPSGLLSLRVGLHFPLPTAPQLDISPLARLGKLQLLEVRTLKKSFLTIGDWKPLDYPSSPSLFNSCLRTVVLSDGLPLYFRDEVIHPATRIRNLIIVANYMGPHFFHNILSRVPHVTHLLLLSQSRDAVKGTFDPLYTLPSLQHIDLESLWETRGFNTVDLISLENVTSFSFALKWFPLREMVQGLKYIISNQLAPNLRSIYTSKKYLDDIPRRKSAKTVMKELIQVLESVNVEWLVQWDGDTFRPMRLLLKEHDTYGNKSRKESFPDFRGVELIS